MRGDGVGVGDIGEVPPSFNDEKNNQGFNHVLREAMHYDRSLDRRCNDTQSHDRKKQSKDGISVGDGAGCGDGACEVHGEGTGGADGMRGDGVGVGDIGEVPGVRGRSGDAAGGDDGGGAGRERDTGVVCGHGFDQLAWSSR